MRVAVGIIAFVSLAGSLIAIAINGCTDPQPKEGYCHLRDIASQAPPDASTACEECLTATKTCCDAYGACEEAGVDCTEPFTKIYTCVLDAGELGHFREGLCLEAGSAAPSAKAVYGCVKDNCAEACGLATAACTPDPGIPKVATPPCDRCATNQCCTSLNGCYRLRPCKLTFECVLSCGVEVNSLYDNTDAGTALFNVLTGLCADGGRPSPDAGSQDLPCISRCFQDYVIENFSETQRTGACAALELFGCTYGNCKSECTGDAGDNDAGDAGVMDAAGD